MASLKSKLYLTIILPLILIRSTAIFSLEANPSCDLPHLRTALVSKVYKDGRLQLESGEIVRLIGVMPVKFIDNPTNSITKRLNKIARLTITLLRKEVQGQEIELYQSGRTHDRYNRLLAHVTTKKGTWLQGLLLQKGLARSYSYADNRACMKKMLTLESLARKEQRGLWRYRLFAPQPALNQKQLLQKRYRFTLVEGRVQKVAVVKGWVFLNFGNNWRHDFTIAIKRKYKKKIAKSGLDLEALAGRTVRVRGWIERWNGPLIKVTHKEQIEQLDKK